MNQNDLDEQQQELFWAIRNYITQSPVPEAFSTSPDGHPDSVHQSPVSPTGAMNSAPNPQPGFTPNTQAALNHTPQSHQRNQRTDNYRGNPCGENLSADIPDWENCRLWITKLPADCTHAMLLNSIRDVGRVWECVINPPRGNHTWSASKLSFFDREAVDRLRRQVQMGQFLVNGVRPKVELNRIKLAANTHINGTRVLIIAGPSALVNVPVLTEFFEARFQYELEKVVTISERPNWRRQAWLFASFRAQAETAAQSIFNRQTLSGIPEDVQALWRHVTLAWGPDPCDRGLWE
ncbi:hypothetical protein F5B20DRAFT_595542 [Whalleya microplaca]|nr:hypothetical protein F5B20DRAFT_595542 [Whalleya microplaca]